MVGALDALMTSVRTAEILAVGTELLTPFRLDTNSLYLTAQLNDLGIDVRSKSVVGDDVRELAARFRDALGRVDLVITTGGLGPTADDVTREVVAEALGLPLVENPAVLETIRSRFVRRGLRMPDANRRQAAVPAGATPLPNTNGTAPGLWMSIGDRVVVLLPGPPRELQPMFEQHVRPELAARSGGRRVWRRVLKIVGRPESHVEEIANPIYSRLAEGPVPIETTILASPGIIELHLSARGEDAAAIEAALERGVQVLAAALAPAVFSVDGRSLEEVIGGLLLARGQRVAVAESCTGGLLAGRLTDVAGSSDWFVGGVVAYANEVKVEALGVAPELLAAHGAVSEPVARAMAEGARQRLHADLGVGVTGIAGPTGGTPEKPVGTVVIAVAAASGTRVRTLSFGGERGIVRQHAVHNALEQLRQALIADSPA
jgi:nicotinamide-nucleotide amidase